MKTKIYTLISVLTLCVFYSHSNDNINNNNIPADAAMAVKIASDDVNAKDIPAIFASNSVQYHSVCSLNWNQSYLPKVDFAIAHNGSNILIHYRVTESRVIGTMENDLTGVYKDSCCELFFIIDGEQCYYNIEANCIGSILMQNGKNRDDREKSSLDNLTKIDRWASLGRKSFGTITDETTWELALVIPLSALWKSSLSAIDGKLIRANVYNCGGIGNEAHYVSWNPIATKKPDFHRPEFFRPIYFCK